LVAAASVELNATAPRYPVATLPYWSRAVTVDDCETPAVELAGSVTDSCEALPGFWTRLPKLVPPRPRVTPLTVTAPLAPSRYILPLATGVLAVGRTPSRPVVPELRPMVTTLPLFEVSQT
jgi:hypothetical protein